MVPGRRIVSEEACVRSLLAKSLLAEPLLAEPLLAEPLLAEPLLAEPLFAKLLLKGTDSGHRRRAQMQDTIRTEGLFGERRELLVGDVNC
jgi:hypothetical protein